MFRSENEIVIGKAKSQEASKAKKSSARPSILPPVSESEIDEKTIESQIIKHSRTHTERQGGFSSFLTSAYSMPPTLEQRARCFFTANAVMWSPTFELVESLCTQTTGDEHLLASINAVGLASFSHSVHAPELMARARQGYVLALRLTNAALRSPTEAKKDSTLFAVMILGVFETIAGTSEDSLAAWSEHINGAAAIVKLRGRNQFKTEAGRRMFQQVTSSLMVSCLTKSTPMPAHIVELRETFESMIDGSNPAWKLSTIIIDITIFRGALRALEIVGPREIIERALEYDRRFLELFEDHPDSWAYETVYNDEDPHLVWQNTYHIYHDTFASQLWNGMRTCRIILHEIILEQLLISSSALKPIFSESEAALQTESSVEISLEMQAGILGSIPYESPSSPQDSRSPHAMTYFILWPLFLVAAMDLTTDEIRSWVRNRLKLIAGEMGIRQAAIMARFLTKQVLNHWSPGSSPENHTIADALQGAHKNILEA